MKLQKESIVKSSACFALLLILVICGITYSQTNVNEYANITRIQELSVICKMSHVISAPGDTRSIRLIAVVPQSIPNVQKINSVEYSIKPTRYFDRNGLKYAEIYINNPDSIEKIVVTISAELYKHDLQTVLGRKPQEQLDEAELKEYLKQERYLEVYDGQIRDIARGIKGRTDSEIVKNIYNYVLDHMEYAVLGRKDRGALYALKRKKGDCSEYSDLFVALCRAKNIPARVITGITVQRDTKTAPHNWAEVYLKNVGWVPFDPSKGDVKNSYLRERFYSSLDPVYIYFTNLRNDYILGNYHYGKFQYDGDRIRVTDSIQFELPKLTK